ncbi:hypothetical protein ABI214_00205 [Prescottella soli]|uniref:Uncharacterized protein n=1 Tax=Prescottella soli TaxID=1543852 RepID=A0ABW9FZY0_9NOCA
MLPDDRARHDFECAVGSFLRPLDGAIVVPTGDGAEAFIDAEEIIGRPARTFDEFAQANTAAWKVNEQ